MGLGTRHDSLHFLGAVVTLENRNRVLRMLGSRSLSLVPYFNDYLNCHVVYNYIGVGFT